MRPPGRERPRRRALAAYINDEVNTIDGGKVLRTNGVEDLFTWKQDQWDALGPKK